MMLSTRVRYAMTTSPRCLLSSKVVACVRCAFLIYMNCWIGAYSMVQLNSGSEAPQTISATAAAQQYYCPARDACCALNTGTAGSESTVAKGSRCKSHISCVPLGNPCSAASGSISSCAAAGSFCRFNATTSACMLDISSHPCFARSAAAQCTASSSCIVKQTWRDTCGNCLRCLEAAKTFAQLPNILRNLSGYQDYRQDAEAASFFKGFCFSTAMAVRLGMEREVSAGCDTIAADTAVSPSLIQRPGALCSRLGMCVKDCTAQGSSDTNGGSSSSSNGDETPAAATAAAAAAAATAATATATAAAAIGTHTNMTVTSAAPSASNNFVTRTSNITAAITLRNSSIPLAVAQIRPPTTQQQQQQEVFSMCSPSGFTLVSPGSSNSSMAAAAAVPMLTKPLQPGACLTSADCSPGLSCDTFTTPTCQLACDPETGLDRCIAAGVCVHLCERPDIRAAEQQSRQRVKPCNRTAQCSPGEDCRLPDFHCTVFTCTVFTGWQAAAVLNPLQSVACPMMCIPCKPQMVNASFTEDGTRIQVLLNQEAAPLDVLCSYIFDETTSDSLGRWSVCTARGRILTIAPAGNVKIRPDRQGLTISRGNTLLAALMDPGRSRAGGAALALFTGSLAAIGSCSSCNRTAVPVSLQGPAVMTLPCDTPLGSPFASSAAASTAADKAAGSGFSFEVLLPTDRMWMLADIQWAAEAAAGGSSAVQAVVNATNNRKRVWARQALLLPLGALAYTPAGPITFTVRVTNIFNTTSTAELTVQKEDSSSAAPTFELEKSVTRFYPSRGIRVSARLLPSACGMQRGRVVWAWRTNIPGVELGGVQGRRLRLSGRTLVGKVEIGKEYNITVVAHYQGSSAVNEDTITMKAVGSPLQIQLLGPSGNVAMNKGNLTFAAAAAAVDPDDPGNVMAGVSILWTCQNQLDLSPCFGARMNELWSIDPGQLQANQQHMVTVTVVKGSRSAAASQSFTPMVKPTASAHIQRACSGALHTDGPADCPARHNPSEPLTLLAIPDAIPAYQEQAFHFAWWVDPARAPAMKTLDKGHAAATGVHGPVLTVLPEALPAGGSVTVNLNMTVFDQEGFAPVTDTSSITVLLNSPPYCSSTPLPNCLMLDSTDGVIPTARFNAYAAGWADPDNDVLTYEFGVLGPVGRRLLSSGSRSSMTFSALSPGEHSLYVCAVDGHGARSCQEATVQVHPPYRHAMEDQLINVYRAFGRCYDDDSDDISDLLDAAMQMAALLNYARATAASHRLHQSSSSSSSGLHSVAPPALSAPAQDATNKMLLLLLAKAGAVQDTADMNSLVAAAAQLSGSSSSRVSVAAGRALLDLFRAGTAANLEEQQHLTLQQSTDFADVLTDGLAAAVLQHTSSSTTTSSSRSSSAAAGNTSTAALRSLKQLPTATYKQQQQQQQQQQLTTLPHSNDTLTSLEAYTTLVDGAWALARVQGITFGGAAAAAGNAAVCVAPALLPVQAAAGFSLKFSCPAVSTPAELLLPSWYSNAACRNNPACADNSSSSNSLLLLGTYYGMEGEMWPLIAGVTAHRSNMLSSNSSLLTTIISGFLNITTNLTGPNGTFCTNDAAAAAGNSTSTSGGTTAAAAGAASRASLCQARIRLPLDSSAYDARMSHHCVLLSPSTPAAAAAAQEQAAVLQPSDVYNVTKIMPAVQAVHKNHAGRKLAAEQSKVASRSAPVAAAVNAAMAVAAAKTAAVLPPTSASAAYVAECLVSKTGLYVIVQSQADLSTATDLDLRSPADFVPGAFSTAPTAPHKDDPHTSQLYTYSFDLEYQSLAANGTNMASFQKQVQQAFLAGVSSMWVDGPNLADSTGALQLAYVRVTNIRPGSVVRNAQSGSTLADVYFMPPKGTTKAQLQKLSELAPAALLLQNTHLQSMLVDASSVAGQHGSYQESMGAKAIAGTVIAVAFVVTSIVLLAVMVPRWRARQYCGSTAVFPSSRHGSNAGFRSACGTLGLGFCGGTALSASPEPYHHQTEINLRPALALDAQKVSGFNPLLCTTKRIFMDTGASLIEARTGKAAPLEDSTQVPDKVYHHNFMFYSQTQDETNGSHRQSESGKISTAISADAAAEPEIPDHNGSSTTCDSTGVSNNPYGSNETGTSSPCSSSAAAAAAGGGTACSAIGTGNSSSGVACRRSRCEACSHRGSALGAVSARGSSKSRSSTVADLKSVPRWQL